MARYLLHVRTPQSPEDAFAFMADLRNFATWDPGVERVRQLRGQGAGADAAFDVTVKGPGRGITLRYETISFEPPMRIVAFAENLVMSSRDTITVKPDASGASDGTGSVVTYDAVVKLKGPLGLADPLFAKTFTKIGDRAATGLIAALCGERMPAS